MLLASKRLRANAILLTALACCLAGCASNRQLAEQVVRSNVAQEDAANQLLLLNILRARYRHPMHFTKISAIRPPVGLGNPTFTIPTPYGPDFTQQIYNISTQFSVQQGADSVVLDTQEFMRGITTPVTPSLMVYMLDQGWPQQMVLHLLVRTIEFYEEKTDIAGTKQRPVMVDRLENAPGNETQFKRFQESIDKLRMCEIDVKSAPRTVWSPKLGKSVPLDVRSLAAAKAADLVLVSVDADGKETTGAATDYVLMRESKAVQFELRDRPESFPNHCPGLQFQVPSEPTGVSKTFAPFRTQVLGALQQGAAEGGKTRESPFPNLAAIVSQSRVETGSETTVPISTSTYAIFNLRSPEAVIYYLGEIARQQAEDHKWDGPKINFRYRPGAKADEGNSVLFRVVQGGDPRTDPVSTEYRGIRYSIEKSTLNDRSMHTLSLVNQIMMLQNKGTDAPATTNVRILQ